MGIVAAEGVVGTGGNPEACANVVVGALDWLVAGVGVRLVGKTEGAAGVRGAIEDGLAKAIVEPTSGAPAATDEADEDDLEVIAGAVEPGDAAAVVDDDGDDVTGGSPAEGSRAATVTGLSAALPKWGEPRAGGFVPGASGLLKGLAIALTLTL